jgi:hypothetical protein
VPQAFHFVERLSRRAADGGGHPGSCGTAERPRRRRERRELRDHDS